MTYAQTAADHFAGNFSDFTRAACDALAQELGYPVEPPKPREPIEQPAPKRKKQ